MAVRIQEQPFDAGLELNRFTAGDNASGAAVCFTGIVRSDPCDPIENMVIEHYPGMTESAVRDIIEAACDRWQINACLVIHRYGELVPGDTIMMVAVRSKHRGEAFQAAQFLMDYLKSRAPFWKKEIRGGKASWVESRAEDEADLRRWSPGK